MGVKRKIHEPTVQHIDILNCNVCGARLHQVLAGLRCRPAFMCLQEGGAPVNMLQLHLQLHVLPGGCGEEGAKDRPGFKFERVSKMCVDGSFALGGRILHITCIYLAPEATTHWGEEVILGAGGWEYRFVAGDWNWRGTMDIMEILASESATELRELPTAGKTSTERTSGRDIKSWSSVPRSFTTASPRALRHHGDDAFLFGAFGSEGGQRVGH